MSAAIAVTIGKLLLKKAVDFATSDEPDKGAWSGKQTLTPVKYGGKKELWYAALDPADPMRWTHSATGYQFRAGDGMTDGGSIPFLFQKLPRKYLRLSPWDNIEAYCLHDFNCRNGFCFVRKGDASEWRMMKMSKKMADVMLWWTLSSKSPTTGVCPTRLETVAITRSVRAQHVLHGQ